MNEVDELSVDEISSSVEESCKSLDVSISRIAKTIQLALGIITIGDIFPNISGTIELVCQCSHSKNSFSKLKLSNDGKCLIGIMFIGKSASSENDCFFFKRRMYKSILNYKLFSIQITDKTQKQMISREFNKWFEQFTNSIHTQFDEFNFKRNNNIELNCCFRRMKGAALSGIDVQDLHNYLPVNDIKDESDDEDNVVNDDNSISVRCSLPPAPCSVSDEDENVYSPYRNETRKYAVNNDSLYYHPDKIKELKQMTLKASALMDRSYVQSPLPIIEKSELIEDKTTTIKSKVKKENKKLTKEQQKILKNLNCKSYTLKVTKQPEEKKNIIISDSNIYSITEV